LVRSKEWTQGAWAGSRPVPTCSQRLAETDRQQYSVEVRMQEVSRAPWYVSQLCVLPHLLSAGLAALRGNV
jgi:hypothetical protein